MIETLRIISATAPDIEVHRGTICDRLHALILEKPQAAPALAICPAKVFVPELLKQIADLASESSGGPPEHFARSLLLAGAGGHVAIEEALLESMKFGLGSSAKPILLHAWGAGFWLLIASLRIQQVS